MTIATNETVSKAMTNRAAWIMRQSRKCWPADASFYLAGGSMSGDIIDLDVFPVEGTGDGFAAMGTIVSDTRNAATYSCSPWPIQVCKYRKPTLAALVESFDFAHIQVGATVRLLNGHATVIDVAFTQAFLDAKAIGSSWFTGSDYPLSSLIRAAKYHKKGVLARSSHIRATIDTLTAVVKRGFLGYDDFKDQLDAVDLGLVPEEFREVAAGSFRELFDLLERKGQ